MLDYGILHAKGEKRMKYGGQRPAHRWTECLSFALLLSLIASSAAAPAFAQDRTIPAFEKGERAMNNRNWARAVGFFTEAIGLNNNNAEAYLKRGQCNSNLGNFDEAIRDFNHVVRLKPGDSDAYLWRGTSNAKAGHHSEAVDDFLKAVRLNPKLAEDYKKGVGGDSSPEKLEQGVKKTNIGAVHDYEEAMRLYSSEGKSDALPTDKHDRRNKDRALDSDTRNGVGLSESTSILKPSAVDIINLNKAIELDSNNPELYYQRGLLNTKLDHYEKSLKDFSKAIFLDPMQAKYYLARARLYHDHNEPDLCKADIEHAQSVDARLPKHIEFK